MTDRELLELAAKAAGLDGDYRYDGYGRGCFVALDGSRFNPLTNDGDALRLAVKLSLTIHQWAEEACVCNVSGTINEAVSFNGDICKLEATRRAIIRAAAEIGKAMK